MVEVRIFGALWEHRASSLEIDLEGRDVAVVDLLARLRLDPAEVEIVTVDRRQSRLDERVPPDCRGWIFPPMFGG